jgi:hypothetical protein
MMASFIAIYAVPFAQNAAVQKQSLQVGELFVALIFLYCIGRVWSGLRSVGGRRAE